MKSINRKIHLAAAAVCLLTLSACQSLFGVPAPTVTPRVTNVLPTTTVVSVSESFATKTPAPKATVVPTTAFTPSSPAVCEPAPVLPVVDAKVDELIPDETQQDWTYGPVDADLTIIEYIDFQCKVCASLALNLRELQALYPEDVRVILRYLQSSENDKAFLAAQAAEAAGLQEKYWQMHDLLLTSQDDWVSLAEEDFIDWLAGQAKTLKLDTAQFKEDLQSDMVVQRVFDANRESAATTLTRPPVVFFNKTMYQNWIDLSSLAGMVAYYQLPERAYAECPKMSVNPEKTYLATFETDKGDMVFELFPKIAPMAVNHFIFLSEEGWYDGSTFYRVVPDYIVQGGDPSGSGNGRPGYRFTIETNPRLRFNEPGMLALATDPNGYNGSQFFITYGSIPEYDGRFTIFGKLVDGLEVLESLRPRDPYYDQVLLPADVLIKVTVEDN